MHYGYELIDTKSGLPYKLFINCQKEIPLHWHGKLEILLVVTGEVTVIIDGQENHLAENDIIIINPNEIHSTRADYNHLSILAGLQISPSYYDRLLQGFSSRAYLLKSHLHSKAFEYITGPIRSALANIFLHNAYGGPTCDVTCLGIVNLLCGYLYKNIDWVSAAPSSTQLGTEEMKRMRRILEKTQDQYAEKITLQALADSEHLSMHYLSHFFSEKMGIGFKEYLTNIRLDQAIERLLFGNQSITQIAHDCGFANITTFYEKFKQRYHCLPSEFKKTFMGKPYQAEQTSNIDRTILSLLTAYLTGEYASLEHLLRYKQEAFSFGEMMHHSV